MRMLTWLIGLLLSLGGVSAAQEQLSFMGYRMEIEEVPGPDEFSSGGPARLCFARELEGKKEKHCYQAPQDFGRGARAEVVRVDKNFSALLFSVASGGVSGFEIHYALLQPGSGKPGREGKLENLFDLNLKISNQSQQRFIEEPKVSDAAVFVTVDSVWGMMEGHNGPHRFIVSSYVRQWDDELRGFHYYLADQFMTVRFYELEQKPDIIAAERKVIRSRLRKAVAAFPRWYRLRN